MTRGQFRDILKKMKRNDLNPTPQKQNGVRKALDPGEKMGKGWRGGAD